MISRKATSSGGYSSILDRAHDVLSSWSVDLTENLQQHRTTSPPSAASQHHMTIENSDSEDTPITRSRRDAMDVYVPGVIAADPPPLEASAEDPSPTTFYPPPAEWMHRLAAQAVTATTATTLVAEDAAAASAADDPGLYSASATTTPNAPTHSLSLPFATLPPLPLPMTASSAVSGPDFPYTVQELAAAATAAATTTTTTTTTTPTGVPPPTTTILPEDNHSHAAYSPALTVDTTTTAAAAGHGPPPVNALSPPSVAANPPSLSLPSPPRISPFQMEQVRHEATRYEKDHATSLPSQQPLSEESMDEPDHALLLADAASTSFPIPPTTTQQEQPHFFQDSTDMEDSHDDDDDPSSTPRSPLATGVTPVVSPEEEDHHGRDLSDRFLDLTATNHDDDDEAEINEDFVLHNLSLSLPTTETISSANSSSLPSASYYTGPRVKDRAATAAAAAAVAAMAAVSGEEDDDDDQTRSTRTGTLPSPADTYDLDSSSLETGPKEAPTLPLPPSSVATTTTTMPACPTSPREIDQPPNVVAWGEHSATWTAGSSEPLSPTQEARELLSEHPDSQPHSNSFDPRNDTTISSIVSIIEQNSTIEVCEIPFDESAMIMAGDHDGENNFVFPTMHQVFSREESRGGASVADSLTSNDESHEAMNERQLRIAARRSSGTPPPPLVRETSTLARMRMNTPSPTGLPPTGSASSRLVRSPNTPQRRSPHSAETPTHSGSRRSPLPRKSPTWFEEEKKEMSPRLGPAPEDDQDENKNELIATEAPDDEMIQGQGPALPPMSPTSQHSNSTNGLKFATVPPRVLSSPTHSNHGVTDLRLVRSVSVTESDVGSIEGLPSNLQSTYRDEGRRHQILQRLDGVNARGGDPVASDARRCASPDEPWDKASLSSARQFNGLNHSNDDDNPNNTSSSSFLDSLGLSFLWGGGSEKTPETPERRQSVWKDQADEAFDLLGCHTVLDREEGRGPVASSLVRVANPCLPSYAEAIRAQEPDLRLQSWVDSHYEMLESPPVDGTFTLGKSRTVIVHEIFRGNWTWCTAWSPKGDRLAIATENHHLAVVETTSSTVWRVRHDKRIRKPYRGDATHSIRAIAWGRNYIAIGGTGNAVSILSPIEPYDILHIVKDTGFVGTLAWRGDSNVLAIGSRSNKLLIVEVFSTEAGKRVQSNVLFTTGFTNWVNCVAFSPKRGSFLATGDASGKLSVYHILDDEKGNEKHESLHEQAPKPEGNNASTSGIEVSFVNDFQLDDSILALNWSPDGRWVYAGGEDRYITVVETKYWESVHRIDRERWVQCIASSSSGTHIAVGGVSSEISILDVRNGWDSVMGIELKGLVPLSATWHPKDLALAATGQNESVIVVETSSARHVNGHHLHSVSPIIAIEFSPDGRTAVIGNEAGIVTFFTLSGSTFEHAYEMVVVLNDRLSVDWSLNGLFVVVGAKDALIVLGPSPRATTQKSYHPHQHTRRHAHRDPSQNPVPFGFSIQRVKNDVRGTNSVSIDAQSQYVAVGGDRTRIFDATKEFRLVKEWKTGETFAVGWSPDGRWLATIGHGKILSIYDTSDERTERWKQVFSLRCDFVGYALAWGPRIVKGLLYLAYGGNSRTVHILEIRTLERAWETVLRIPREGVIRDLHWSESGLLASGIDNGTVSIVDLAYLQSGIAVNEKDYNWQRQALTCQTEIRRNRGRNSIQAVRWIPSAPGSDSLLAVAGTDGEVEILDLTERKRCRGYGRR